MKAKQSDDTEDAEDTEESDLIQDLPAAVIQDPVDIKVDV
jgi:hypothetical protein